LHGAIVAAWTQYKNDSDDEGVDGLPDDDEEDDDDTLQYFNLLRRQQNDQRQQDTVQSHHVAFQMRFCRRMNGLYFYIRVTQKSYVPADLRFTFYEPVSMKSTELFVPESSFDELKRKMGDCARLISPYSDRQEWVRHSAR
jgi:hypothetical protein